MDENQNGRRSISLTKEDDKGTPRVREAYPVYNHNADRSELERQEYRNSPVQPAYQQPQDSPYYEDPMPAVNRYGSPERQPQYGRQPEYQNQDGLGQYYNYDVPQREMPQVEPRAAMPPVPQQPVPGQHVQQQMKFCKYCGERIAGDAVVCPHCGRQIEELRGAGRNATRGVTVNQTIYNQQFDNCISEKSRQAAVILAALGFTGIGGLHRFYLGKPLSGLLYLFSGGLCGIGTLIDLITIASGTFKDGSGKIVKKQ